MRHLRQKHRTEFAGADQDNTNWFARGMTGIEEMMKVHETGPVRRDFESRADGLDDDWIVMAEPAPATTFSE
jgi:hypothetical protein